MVDKNEIKGAAKEAGGKVKEAVGSAVGNERMRAQGEADQAEGKTQKNYGKVKDAVKDQSNH
ncbi:CsbD family protein [Fulvimarina sp. MAC8]|uniref:CsbD family protein n=1 Tax=Fulvimarina sp. MAC8 TaxID=3162874 RepID=UPI0032ED605D